MRVAKLSLVAWDKGKSRWEVKRQRVPQDVQAVIGRTIFVHKFRQGLSEREANELALEVRADWARQIRAARSRPVLVHLPPPAIIIDTPPDGLPRSFLPYGDCVVTMPADSPAIVHGIIDRKRIATGQPIADADGCLVAYGTGGRQPPQPGSVVSRVVEPAEIVAEWAKERRADHNPPKSKAIANKERKLRDLFAFLQCGHTDLGRLSEDDLLRYRRHLLGLGGKIARDHLIDIKALFAVADRAGLLRPNPAAGLVVPAKAENKRPPFSDAEAAAILVAARAADPVVRWANWLAAFTTAINSEILEAEAAEFYQIESGQWVFDMRGRKLKTGFRPRIVPLHPAIIREGFADYLASRQGNRLFDGNADHNSNRLNDFLHDMGIDKTFYSWRHRVIHRLDKLTTASLSRFIAGHAAKDVHEKFYLHHELPEEFGDIIAAIGRLADPTAEVRAG